MPKINRPALRKLANHLINGQLGHVKFDFSVWNHGDSEGKKNEFGNLASCKPYKCGYEGCAIGECPVIFRKEGWRFDKYADPVFKRTSDPIESATRFFGITKEVACHLFTPDMLLRLSDGTYRKGLREGSHRKTVGKNILKFLELTKGKECPE